MGSTTSKFAMMRRTVIFVACLVSTMLPTVIVAQADCGEKNLKCLDVFTRVPRDKPLITSFNI